MPDHLAPPVVEAAKVEDVPAEVVPPVDLPADDEYELELAEDSVLSQEDLDVIAQYSYDHGLNKTAAEKLIAMKEAAVKKSTSSYETQQTVKHEADKALFLADEMFASPEIAAQSWDAMAVTLETFGDDELTALLMKPGVGDQLPIARMLKKIGDLLKPSTETPGGKGVVVGAEKKEISMAQQMYPNLNWDS